MTYLSDAQVGTKEVPGDLWATILRLHHDYFAVPREKPRVFDAARQWERDVHALRRLRDYGLVDDNFNVLNDRGRAFAAWLRETQPEREATGMLRPGEVLS